MNDLADRVKQFNTLQLPGQPMGMHMGTSTLVNDLWREVERLRAALAVDREACAALAEDLDGHSGQHIAAAIRARSNS